MNEFFVDEVLLCKDFIKENFISDISKQNFEIISDNHILGDYLNSVLSDFRNHGKKADTVIYIDDFESKKQNRSQKLLQTLNNLSSNQKFLYVSLFSFEKGFCGEMTSVAEREFTAAVEADSNLIKASEVVECEKALSKFADRIEIKSVRFVNLFGPSVPLKGDLFDIINPTSENKHIILNKSDFGKNFSAVYVRDAVKIIVSILILGKSGNIYNGSTFKFNKAELKTKIYNLLKNKNCHLQYVEDEETSSYSFLKCDKINNILNFDSTDSYDALLRTFADSATEYLSEHLNQVYDGKFSALRKAETEMLFEVDRICKENEVEYFLIGGTLLGAERHKGFIPWDDDIDICMMRGDYEKFRKICPSKLSEKYAYQSHRTDKNIHYIFDKIRLKNTYFSSEHSNNFDTIQNGVFLDIFVFDKTSDIKFFQKLHVALIVMLRRLIHVKWTNKPVNGRFALISKLLLPILRLLPFSLFHNMFEKILRFYERKKTHNILDGTGLYIKKGALPAEWMEKIEAIPFENGLFPAPVKRGNYLKMWYGDDYMNPPSISKRLGHDIARFDLGDFAVNNESSRTISLKGELYDKQKGEYFNEQ